jgi:hypothetical protein
MPSKLRFKFLRLVPLVVVLKKCRFGRFSCLFILVSVLRHRLFTFNSKAKILEYGDNGGFQTKVEIFGLSFPFDSQCKIQIKIHLETFANNSLLFIRLFKQLSDKHYKKHYMLVNSNFYNAKVILFLKGRK